METTKNDRIKRVIEYKNITQVDLANILGVKKQLIQNWVSNAQPVPDKYILMLIDKYIDIDARWLATGFGQDPTSGIGDVREKNDPYQPAGTLDDFLREFF